MALLDEEKTAIEEAFGIVNGLSAVIKMKKLITTLYLKRLRERQKVWQSC